MAISSTLRAASALQKLPLRRPIATSLTLFPAAPNGIGETRDASPPPLADGRSLKPVENLVGIARLAASSSLAEAKRGTEYFLLPVRSILNHCNSPRVPFAWTVNPYRGCEFGCHYCYARYTHEYMELDGGDFERKIYVKDNASALVARDLENEKIWGEHIAIGSATDPYQPAEGEFKVTRAILEQMAKRDGLQLSITTKSNRVVRDIELLKKISERSALSVNLSVTTVSTRLARLLEPRAPRPDLRLAAVHSLRDAGISAGVLAMPIVPGITDGEDALDALARAARDAGAQWFAGRVLFLMPAALKQFIPFVEAKFPKLARQYREWYVQHGNAPESYRREISERIERLRKKYAFDVRPDRSGDHSWRSPQIALALGTQTPSCAAPPKMFAASALTASTAQLKAG
ncbi:MAG TPA: radical SAM protein [Candidatus Acidoferrales bacterium]|nr:radical SAM protein [Candidatus Acidoferrales bacterium]